MSRSKKTRLQKAGRVVFWTAVLGLGAVAIYLDAWGKKLGGA